MYHNHLVYIIVAADAKDGIAKAGKIPWHLSQEMAYFRQLTTKTKENGNENAVIMGRKTWESLPPAFRPLPRRINIVITQQNNYAAPGASVAKSLEESFTIGSKLAETLFVIGGASIYALALSSSFLDGIYLTRIEHDFQCDSFFPGIPLSYEQKLLGRGKEQNLSFTFLLSAPKWRSRIDPYSE